MKHFMQPRNAILREMKMESPASPNPSVAKPWLSWKQRGSKENIPLSDPNFLCPILKHSPVISAAKLKSLLPPQPLSLNPLKRKPRMETVPKNSIMRTCESSVQMAGCGF